MSLSTIGAALAGVGVGALVADSLSALAWPLFGIGVAAHLLGMVGTRKLLMDGGYDPPVWQKVGYWACWVVIAAIFAAWLWSLVQ